jgi:BASS family bile acid:Na+ symporter
VTERLLRIAQRRLLALLLATYALGAFAPALGLRLRGVRVVAAPWPGGATVAITLPMVMLGFLLVVAGIGAKTAELRHLARRPALPVVGLVANVAVPILFAFVAAALLSFWHSPDEAQSVLVGLAMIGAMPIAGASTAWSQNADGNVALSLGLVLGSTALSPVLTPLGLHAVGWVTRGDYSEDLHELARQGSAAFVWLAVVIPSVLGLALRLAAGARRVEPWMPALKLLNLADLLVLNYVNAAAALPKVVAQPDWDFAAITLGITGALCATAFALGGVVARAFGGDERDVIALTFGLGMNNNGTGLVLAESALADHPLVLLPILLYNLVQQIAAGVVDAGARRRARSASPA